MRAPDFQIRAELQKAFSEFGQGQMAAAEARASGILKRIPREPNALYLMGIIHHKNGDLRVAARYFEKSYKVNPENPMVLSGIGIVRLDQGKYGEAVRIFENLTRKLPNDVSVLNNLGVSYKGLSKFDLAIRSFENAIRIDASFPDSYINLGSLLNGFGEADAALNLLEKGMRHCPGNRSILLNLSDALVGLGRLMEAREILDRQFKENSLDCEVRSRLGFLMVSLGDIDNAEIIYKETIEMDESNPSNYFDLADLMETKPGNCKEKINEIRSKGLKIFSEGNRRSIDSVPAVMHRAAQAAESLKNHDLAFRLFKGAQDNFKGRLASIGRIYDRVATEDHATRLIEWFSDHDLDTAKAFQAGTGPVAKHGPRPIFIVGMPRSGTSLLEQILASHPGIHGGGELLTLPELVTSKTGVTGDISDLIRQMTVQDAIDIRDGYLSHISSLSPKSDFVTDKLPFNYISVGLIRMVFPDCLILNIERHPLDVCWSIYTQRFSSEMLFDHDLRDIGHYYRQYDRLMGFWKQWDPGIVPIQYEELLEDMGRFILPVLDRIGLDWDPKMERFFENRRVVQTASRLQVRRPIYKSSVGRWSQVESHLGGLKTELGDLAGPLPDTN